MVASREKEIKEINRFMLFWLGKLKLAKLIVLSWEFDVTWSTVPLLVKLVVVFVFAVVVRISVVEFLVEGISSVVVVEVVVEMFAEVKAGSTVVGSNTGTKTKQKRMSCKC